MPKIFLKFIVPILIIVSIGLSWRVMNTMYFPLDNSLNKLYCKQVSGSGSLYEFENMDVSKRKVFLNAVNIKSITNGDKEENKVTLKLKLINNRELVIYFDNEYEKNHLVNSLKNIKMKNSIEINM